MALCVGVTGGSGCGSPGGARQDDGVELVEDEVLEEDPLPDDPEELPEELWEDEPEPLSEEPEEPEEDDAEVSLAAPEELRRPELAESVL